MFHVVFCILLLVIYMYAVADQLPRLGKRELIYLLSATCLFLCGFCSVFHVVFCILLLVIYMYAVADRLPRLGKRELIICYQLLTCFYVVSVRRGFLFLLVLEIGCVILLWHSQCLPYDYFDCSSLLFLLLLMMQRDTPPFIMLAKQYHISRISEI